MINHRVLLTGVGGPAGQALVPQLLAKGLFVVGVDMQAVVDPDIVTHLVPPAQDPRMLSELRHLVEDYGITLVIPTVSEELPLIARERAQLGDRVEVVIGRPEPVLLAHDKYLTAERLHSGGVAVPGFGLPAHFRDADEAYAYFDGPFILKPRVSRGARGVVLVDRPDLVDWADVPRNYVVQEFASGPEFAPVVYRSEIDRERPDSVVVLEKTGLTHGPVGNATGVRRDTAGEHDDVGQLALAATEALGLAGPADIDVRRRADGEPVVLEINARFGANSSSAPEILDAVLAAGTERRISRLAS